VLNPVDDYNRGLDHDNDNSEHTFRVRASQAIKAKIQADNNHHHKHCANACLLRVSNSHIYLTRQSSHAPKPPRAHHQSPVLPAVLISSPHRSNFFACTGPSDCISLDGSTSCTCYTRASNCNDGNGVCLLADDEQQQTTPCTDDSNCQLLDSCVQDDGGSYCYNPFPACVGEAPTKRMLKKRGGDEIRMKKRKDGNGGFTSPYRRGLLAS